MDPPLRFTTFSVTIPPVPTQSPREPPAASRYNLVSPHQSSLFVPSLGLADASSLVVCFAIFLARSICLDPALSVVLLTNVSAAHLAPCSSRVSAPLLGLHCLPLPTPPCLHCLSASTVLPRLVQPRRLGAVV